MRISDWRSDVCSSDLRLHLDGHGGAGGEDMQRGVQELGGADGADLLHRPEDTGRRLGLLRRGDLTQHEPGRVRRSEESRVGNECGRKCEARWSRTHNKQQNKSKSIIIQVY